MASAADLGDFQTPPSLAREVLALLARRGPAPASVLEPTCGGGSFLAASADAFPAARLLGLDLSEEHVAAARAALGDRAEVRRADFFATDWDAVLADLPDPVLIVGNPPWVTTSALGGLGSGNQPPRTNRGALRGIDAITGRGGFDISEWIVLTLLDRLAGRRGTLAMLVKTAAARKILEHAWREGRPVSRAAIHRVPALREFRVSVDACLLVLDGFRDAGPPECPDHGSLAAATPDRVLGRRGGRVVPDAAAWDRTRHLEGEGPAWRSGVKHDCAKVMELRPAGDGLANGLGERVDLEPDCLYPLLKSSEVADPAAPPPVRRLLVTQTRPGEDTTALRERAPRTWAYLERHADRLAARRSAVFRGRGPFAVFGVGDYTFAPAKVAVSGFYHPPRFRVVGPHRGRPVVLDDTCYLAPFPDLEVAAAAARLLDSDPAREFLAARIFPSAKRPVTVGVLDRLSLAALERATGPGTRHFSSAGV
jgi:hypothetical protein